MLIPTKFASEVHDAHDLHFDAPSSPIMRDNYRRAMELTRNNPPFKQGRAIIIPGITAGLDGQFLYSF